MNLVSDRVSDVCACMCVCIGSFGSTHPIFEGGALTRYMLGIILSDLKR